jgi:hypothetical protein
MAKLKSRRMKNNKSTSTHRKDHAMDDQVLEKVKECAITYLGMQKDDFVSVSEVFNDDKAQGFDVKVQGKETPATGKCFVVVKDGQASIVTEPGESVSSS